jgi:hypothetical protein
VSTLQGEVDLLLLASRPAERTSGDEWDKPVLTEVTLHTDSLTTLRQIGRRLAEQDRSCHRTVALDLAKVISHIWRHVVLEHFSIVDLDNLDVERLISGADSISGARGEDNAIAVRVHYRPDHKRLTGELTVGDLTRYTTDNFLLRALVPPIYAEGETCVDWQRRSALQDHQTPGHRTRRVCHGRWPR